MMFVFFTILYHYNVFVYTSQAFVPIVASEFSIDIEALLLEILHKVIFSNGLKCKHAYLGVARKAHAGKAVILRDDNIPRSYPVDQRKIHAVGTLI